MGVNGITQLFHAFSVTFYDSAFRFGGIQEQAKNTLEIVVPLVETLSEPSEKSAACKLIIEQLPDWFGIPDANASYIEGVSKETAIVMRDPSGVVAGLLSLRFPFPNNADIYWLGVLPGLHRQGTGRALFERALKIAADKGCSTITVETLGPSRPDEGYARTRKFYEAMGFSPLFELTPYGTYNPLLYMVRQITS